MRPRFALWAACLLAASLVSVQARADLPPPPGQTRVSYSFRVAGEVRDVVLVAFPIYTAGGKYALELELGKDATPVQGWTPGIYAIRAGDFSPVKDSTDDSAVRQVLESKGRLCVKKVPRVFTVPTSTKVTSLRDEFAVQATPEGCRATLEKTLYRGANREEGEGTVDSSGRRVPPAPFGSELPAIGDRAHARARARAHRRGQGVRGARCLRRRKRPR